MRLPQILDFSLKQVVLTPDIRQKVQSRKASLLILPIRPHPPVYAALQRTMGVLSVSDEELLHAARIALHLGLITPPITPIGIGCAFSLYVELPSAKFHRFGTGIVHRMGISRLHDLVPGRWRQAGYESLADFMRYWDQAAADLEAIANPWCWLIEFDFRG